MVLFFRTYKDLGGGVSLVDLQVVFEGELPVSEGTLVAWVTKVLEEENTEYELTLRLVDIQEITHLNKMYRKKDKPTNVLAFPSAIPDTVVLEYPFLGDVIICPAVLQKEASEQNIPLNAHWAHIVTHGVLHLLGYDHQAEEDTKVMQNKEITVLASLGFHNPYPLENIEGD